MPPTSSWWALETALTMARRGSGRRPIGGHGGGGDAVGVEIVQQPPPQPGLRGTRSHECGRELEEGGSTARRHQEELLRWQQVGGCRTRWTGSRTTAATVPKVPYRPDGETSEKTRVT